MLDTSDRLSLLALIVAVVALIVSGWQLAQQLFATAADGKRFCQGSVMGIWARKTRLSWRWSQIRFETKYTTPEIRMTSGIREDLDNASGLRTTSASNGGKRRPRYSRMVYKIPILGWFSEAWNGPPSDWSGYIEVTSDRPDTPLELRKTVRPNTDPVLVSAAEKFSWWKVQTWDHSYSEDSPDIVSWPIFLQSIYVNQISSIRKIEPAKPEEESKRESEPPSPKQVGSSENQDEDEDEPPYRGMTVEEKRLREDRVVVRLVERSWDLIPPDVVRPLAKSTVGTMIVIAHRLGMSWLGDFNPSEGVMNAAGSGHTFTSETVRGLGMVIQYTHHEESKKLKNLAGSGRGLGIDECLAPTSIADKLHCGVLPIDHEAVRLGKRDDYNIDLIDVTRKLDLDTVLRRLGVPKESLDMLKKSDLNQYGSLGRDLKHVLEEAVSLLCPIPTLPDYEVGARWIVWPFRSFRFPFTPFRQREGIQALRDQLDEYMKGSKPGTNIMNERKGTHIRHLSKSPLECLELILAAWPLFRQHRNEPKNAPRNSPLAQRACEKYRVIYQIHQETSRVFKELSTTRLSDDETVNPFLIDMAGAQATLAAKYGREADQHAVDEGAKENLSEGDTRPEFVRKLAQLYVEDLHKEHGRAIRKHLKRTGYVDKLQPGEVPALWWTAVVRSVCWFVSVRIRLPETQIPSVWYDSQTPVYIT